MFGRKGERGEQSDRSRAVWEISENTQSGILGDGW